MAASWHVYLLRCCDDTLYTGVTTDIPRRLKQHNGELGGGPRYTSGRRPVELLWCEPAQDRGAAQRREAAVRRLSRRDKLAMVSAAARSSAARSSAARSSAARSSGGEPPG